MLLEHELWLYASRHEAGRVRFAERFAEARRRVVDSTGSWPDGMQADPPGTPDQVASLLVALLVGLEMQHRVDPGAISDETAVLGLRMVTGLGRGTEPTSRTSRSQHAPTADTTSTSTSTTPKPGAPRRKSPTRRTS